MMSIKFNNLKENDFNITFPFSFKENFENEFLIFLKPEFFYVGSGKQEMVLAMIEEKLRERKVETSGMALLSGNFLAKNGIIDRHYGLINKFSKNAGNLLGPEDKKKISDLININDLSNYEILGAHEALGKYYGNDIKKLNDSWIAKTNYKIKSGCYGQPQEINGKNIILINGFHPAQINHFTDKDQKILLILAHSDTDWKILKNELAGHTFPEKATPGSIRGELYMNKSKYGIANVGASLNFIHLSAGPFEALFEINNFFTCFPEIDFDILKTNIGKRMNMVSDAKDKIIKLIDNPAINIEGSTKDLFSLTEEKNTIEAVKLVSEVNL